MAYVRNKHVSHTEQDSGHVDTVARPPEALAPDLYKQVRFPTRDSCNLAAAANTLLLYSTNKSFSHLLPHLYTNTTTQSEAHDRSLAKDLLDVDLTSQNGKGKKIT